MTFIAVRAWLCAIVALLLAAAGVMSLAAGSTVTSLTRMAVAAAALAAYTTAAALLVTPRDLRSWPRCLWWGGLVPVVIAIVTTVLVADQSGLGAGLLAGTPWLCGAVPVCLAGRWLPSLVRRADPGA